VTLAQLDLTGDLARPARLTVPDLLAWPLHRVRVSFECATSGTQHHRFAGPRLHDVLSAAGPGFDPVRRKDRLRFLIAVTGTDGHHALLSWAEIDPDFAHAPVLLAVSIDDPRSTGPDPNWCFRRTAAGPGTSAGSTRYGWTGVTGPGGRRRHRLRPRRPRRGDRRSDVPKDQRRRTRRDDDAVLHVGTVAAGRIGLAVLRRPAPFDVRLRWRRSWG